MTAKLEARSDWIDFTFTFHKVAQTIKCHPDQKLGELIDSMRKEKLFGQVDTCDSLEVFDLNHNLLDMEANVTEVHELTSELHVHLTCRIC